MMSLVLLQAQQVLTEQDHLAAEEFTKMDPTGIGLTLVAMCIVFSVLVLVFLAYQFLLPLVRSDRRKVVVKEEHGNEIVQKAEETPAEVNAAIAMALYFYNEQLHDFEQTVLTIRKVARNYSPWSSKIYGLRNVPR
jgi:Na+-transporting methylmalonyl-CoA/oxaloacetate decarboxylase gamma subunit